MSARDRVVIVGVVHGQQSCIDEVQRVITMVRPEIVAVELPPAFSSTKAEDLEETRARIELSHDTFFRTLENIGLAGAVELKPLALGLAMQGFEFLAGIEAGHAIGARIEFIDMARDALFWEFIRELPPLKLPTWKDIKAGIGDFLEHWKDMLAKLLQIYAEPDYATLSSRIGPLMASLEGNPVFKNVLVEQRNHYMARKIALLLKESTGKIVVLTGFGHVDGLTREIHARA